MGVNPMASVREGAFGELPIVQSRTSWRYCSPKVGFVHPEASADFRPHAPVQLFIKRGIDILVSFCAIVVLLPALIAIGIAIKMDTPGPALFTQVRWGMHGRKILIFKFRTMNVAQCDPSGVAQTVRNDPRTSRVGALLRRTNLDELPQLFNVLLGDMSLVGPRCHVVGMLGGGVIYEALVPNYHARHAVRPGITGLAQMRGLRGPTDKPSLARARVCADLYYVQHFNIWMDMVIIWRTFVNEVRGGTGF